MKIALIEWFIKLLAISGCAILGIFAKNIITNSDYHYLIGWIAGSISIGLCQIIHCYFHCI